MDAETAILIPARLASERLPEKPLADLGGRPLIVRVWEQACRAAATYCAVVTDSPRVAEVVEAHGGRVVMTRADHASGTDRLAEAAACLELAPETVVVNLQGDEPLMPSTCLRQVAGLLGRHASAQMATLWWPVADRQEWISPDAVKIVVARDGRALYFSRAPLPFARDGSWPEPRRHLGIYAYRAGALARWPTLEPSPLEAVERLEQLRALEAGWTIVAERAAEAVPAGVDTAEDLARVARLFDSGAA